MFLSSKMLSLSDNGHVVFRHQIWNVTVISASDNLISIFCQGYCIPLWFTSDAEEVKIAAKFVVYFQLLTGVSLTQNSDCWGAACVMVHLLTGHQIWYNHRHDTRESLWDKVKLVMLHGQSVSVPYDQYKKTSLWDYSLDKYCITFSSFYPLLYYCFYSVKKLQYCGKSKVCLSMTLKIECSLLDCLISGEIWLLSI